MWGVLPGYPSPTWVDLCSPHGQSGRGPGVPDLPTGEGQASRGRTPRRPQTARSRATANRGRTARRRQRRVLRQTRTRRHRRRVLIGCDAIAQALQLDDTERAHLFDLARAADGIPTSGQPRRRATKQNASRPSLHWALEAITDGIAFVRNPQQDLLATNALGRVFYTPLIGDGGRTPNLARFQFLDPASWDFYPDWDLFAEMCVAIMRAEAGRDPHDRGLQNLVGELSTQSETFRTLWGSHNVRTHGTGTKRFNHPDVGELVLAYEELAITAEPGLVLIIYTAEPGSPSTERLQLLASLAAEQTPQAALQADDHPH